MSRYLKSDNYLLFLASILLAAFFHITALLGLIYFAVEMLIHRKKLILWVKKNRRLFLKISCIVGAIGILGIILIWDQLIALYNRTLSGGISINIGLMLPLKILFLFGSLFLVTFYNPKDKDLNLYFQYIKQHNVGFEKRCNNTLQRNISTFRTIPKIITLFYLIGLLLAFSGYVMPFASRISMMFYLYEAVYFGWLIKKGESPIFLCFIALLLGYIFIDSISGNGHGIFPYLFFWQ